MLSRLQVKNFRNFQQAALEFKPGLNLLHGPNGAGKTSLLEALFVLTQGKSFRAKDLDHLIHQSASEMSVYAQLERQADLQAFDVGDSLGYSRQLKGASERQMNGQRGVKLSAIAHALPLQFIDTNSHRLLAESASYRRGVLNWGVFHFVPEYGELWQRHKQILRQRNACLKQGGQQIEIWSDYLATTAQQLSEMQSDYLEVLLPQLNQNWQQLFSGDMALELSLYRGWPRDSQIQDLLRHQLDADLRLGYTQYGSHRADLRLKIAGQPAAKYLSQGQLKILMFALKSAQVELLRQMGQQDSLVLIDDLTAELDCAHQLQLLQYLGEVSPQILLTSASQVTVDSLLSQLTVTQIAIDAQQLQTA